MSNKIELDTRDLPPIKLILTIGQITERPDGDSNMEIDIEWLDLQERMNEFVIDALKRGIKDANTG